MATKKKPAQTAKLGITCYDNSECDVKVDGDPQHLIAAFASLMDDDNENNAFRQLMVTAIQVILFKDKAAKKKKPAKKKTVTKKKK